MRRSRAFLAIVAILGVVLMVGLCSAGGPPTERQRPQAGDQSGAGMPGAGPGAGAGAGGAAGAGGLSAGGSAGSGSVSGSAPQGGGISLDALGLNKGVIWSGRIAYELAAFSGTAVRITGDYAWADYKGSIGSYAGPLRVELAPGEAADTQFKFGMLSIAADFDVIPLAGCGFPIHAGPKVQYINWADRLTIDNLNRPAVSDSLSRSFGMFGLGGFTAINLAAVSGLSYGRTVPVLYFGGAYGYGRDTMRYWMWDVSLKLFGDVKKDDDCGSSSTWRKALMAEVGYAVYGFQETRDKQSFVPGVVLTAESNVDLRITVPFVRGTFAF
jgi:hypothetical protein